MVGVCVVARNFDPVDQVLISVTTEAVEVEPGRSTSERVALLQMMAWLENGLRMISFEIVKRLRRMLTESQVRRTREKSEMDV